MVASYNLYDKTSTTSFCANITLSMLHGFNVDKKKHVNKDQGQLNPSCMADMYTLENSIYEIYLTDCL